MNYIRIIILIQACILSFTGIKAQEYIYKDQSRLPSEITYEKMMNYSDVPLSTKADGVDEPELGGVEAIPVGDGMSPILLSVLIYLVVFRKKLLTRYKGRNCSL